MILDSRDGLIEIEKYRSFSITSCLPSNTLPCVFFLSFFLIIMFFFSTSFSKKDILLWPRYRWPLGTEHMSHYVPTLIRTVKLHLTYLRFFLSVFSVLKQSYSEITSCVLIADVGWRLLFPVWIHWTHLSCWCSFLRLVCFLSHYYGT